MDNILSKIKNLAKQYYRYHVSDKGYRADIDKAQAGEEAIMKEKHRTDVENMKKAAPAMYVKKVKKPLKKVLPTPEPMNHYEKAIKEY